MREREREREREKNEEEKLGFSHAIFSAISFSFFGTWLGNFRKTYGRNTAILTQAETGPTQDLPSNTD